MATDPSSPERGRSPGGDLRTRVSAYLAGERSAAESICAELEPVVRATVRRFYPDTDSDHDDLVQETLVAFLAYLQRGATVPDSIEAFVVTMAGNRCRNLFRRRKLRPGVELSDVAERIAVPEPDALEVLEVAERDSLLRAALDRLGDPCRRLLTDIYVEGRPMEEIQRELGLSTVQGAYYRKYSCLKKLSRVLKKLCFDRQPFRDRQTPNGTAGDAREF